MPSVIENISPIYSPVPSLQYPDAGSWLSPLGAPFTQSPEQIDTLTSFPPYPSTSKPNQRLSSLASTAEVDKLLPDFPTPEKNQVQDVLTKGLQHPGPPWYRWADMPRHPPFVVRVGERTSLCPSCASRIFMANPTSLEPKGQGK